MAKRKFIKCLYLIFLSVGLSGCSLFESNVTIEHNSGTTEEHHEEHKENVIPEIRFSLHHDTSLEFNLPTFKGTSCEFLPESIKTDSTYNDGISIYDFVGCCDDKGKLICQPIIFNFTEEHRLINEEFFTYNFEDYTFYVDYVKNSYEEYFDIHLFAKFNSKLIEYQVTYKNVDGTILDIQHVRPIMPDSSNRYEINPADGTYLGLTPKYFDIEKPIKFVGFDKSLDIITNDIETTAMYEEDKDIMRLEYKYNNSNSFSGDFNQGKYISSIHNTTNVNLTIDLFRYNTFLKSIRISPDSTHFFDITEGIDKFEVENSLNESQYGKSLIVDYFKKYDVAEPIVWSKIFEENNYLFNLNADLPYYIIPAAAIDDKGKLHNLSKIIVNNCSIDKEIIFLEGFNTIDINYKDYNYYKIVDSFNVQIPNSLSSLDTHLPSVKEICGCTFFGNRTNPFLCMVEGKTYRIPNSTKIINKITLLGPEKKVVFPKSVEHIYNIHSSVTSFVFEDLDSVLTLEFISVHEVDELYIPKRIHATRNSELCLNSGKIGKLYLYDGMIIQKSFFNYLTNIGEIVLYGNSLTPNLVVENGSLYSSDFKTLYCLVDNGEQVIRIRDGVNLVFENALNLQGFNDMKGEVYFPYSVRQIDHQGNNHYFFLCANENVYCNEPHYFVPNDLNRLTKDGLVYGILNSKEIAVINSIPEEITDELVIPDFVEFNGVKYDVTNIDNLGDCRNYRFKSIKLSSHLKVIRENALAVTFEGTLVLPESIEIIKSLPKSAVDESGSVIIPFKHLKEITIFESNIGHIEYVSDTFLEFVNLLSSGQISYDVYYGHSHNTSDYDFYSKLFLNIGGEIIKCDDISEITTEYTKCCSYFIQIFQNLNKVHFDIKHYGNSDKCEKYGYGLKEIYQCLSDMGSIANYNIEYDSVFNINRETFIDMVLDEKVQYIDPETKLMTTGNLYSYDELVNQFFVNGEVDSHYERLPNSSCFSVNLLDGEFTINLNI